jgi:hypothetical protein
MELVPTAEARAALLQRAKNILIQPKSEWPLIGAEPATIGSIYSNYVVYLAAVPALCTLIGSLVFGYGVGGITFRPSISAALVTAVVQYALQLGGVYVFALIIDWLAPRFGGEQNRINAFKLAAYSATASWLAGVFGLIPALGVLSILGLYSLYLLYTGVPFLTKVAPDKAFSFTAAIVGVGIVLGILLGILGAVFLPHPTADAGKLSGKVNLPGGVTVNLDKLDEATKRWDQISKQMEQTAVPDGKGDNKNAESGSGVSPDDMKALIPASLPGGFAQTALTTSTAGAGGFNFGNAKADYAKGDASITLSLTDMGAMGALASLGGIFGINASEETATSYSKLGKVDGRMTIEEFNRETKSGKYATMVKDRILVDAEGQNATMDELKAAVGAIDLSSVEALAGN